MGTSPVQQRQPSGVSQLYRFDGFLVDVSSMELRDAEGKQVEIPPLAFDLLVHLINNRARVVSKAELFDRLWGDVAVSENSLAQSVWAARRALRDTGGEQRVIKNVRGRGYRFVADLEEQPQRRSAPQPATTGIAAPSSTGLVGRVDEVARMSAALEQCEHGKGAVLLVSGDAGIGKTRLTEELIAIARQRSARVCEGRCFDDQGLPPLWPFQQAARELIRQLAPEAVAAHIGEAAGDLVKLIPELRECIPTLQPAPVRMPDEERYQLFDAMTRLLRFAAKDETVVVLLDDIHWADQASLLLLEFISAVPSRCKLLLVCTFRDDEPRESLTRAVSSALRVDSTQRIRLEGLDPSEVAQLLRMHRNSEPAPELVQRVYEFTNGNPFFVSQLARWLAHQPGETVELKLPREARDLLRQRFARLSASCQQTLSVAAVLGMNFRLGDLRRAARLEADEALTLLEHASEARVVHEDDNQVGLYHFSHPTIRETIYEAVPRSQRAALHKTIADAIATAHADDPTSRLGELAHHYYEAAAGGAAPQAVHYLRLAAEVAVQATAFEEARDYYGRALQALELTDPVDERLRCELMLGQGKAMRGANFWDPAPRKLFADVVARAKALGDKELLAEGALCYAGRGPLRMASFRSAGTLDAAEIAFLEEALASLGDEESGRRALVMGWLAWSLYNSQQRERRKELSFAAVALARRVGDNTILAEVLMTCTNSVRGPSQLDARIAMLSEIIELTRVTGAKALQLDACASRGWARFERGDLAGAQADLDDSVRLAEELEQPTEKHWSHAWEAMRLFGDGRFEELDRRHQDSLKNAAGVPSRDNQGLAIRQFMTLTWRGMHASVIPGLEAYAERYPLPVAWHCGLTSTYASAGRLDDARREFDRLSAGGFAAIPDDHNWIWSHCCMATACSVLLDKQQAGVLYEKLLPFADRMALIGLGGPCGGVVHLPLGKLALILDRVETARTHLEQAIEQNARLGARIWAASAQLDLAALIIERCSDDAEQLTYARSLIEAADGFGRERDLTVVCDRAAELAALL